MSERTGTYSDVLKEGNVAFFECDTGVVPDSVRSKKSGRIRMYKRGLSEGQMIGQHAAVLQYERTAQIREDHSDIYFLDKSATKVLFADFPATAQFVFVRCVPRLSWLLGILGLLRRMYIGLVRVHGVVSLQAGDKKYRWLLIEHNMAESHNPRLCLSEEVGVQGFIDFLNKEHIRYVVLRFYEKLPQLNRAGGDLDILVSDTDDSRLRAFLQQHPGPIGVDVWTVSRATHGAITYYPPPLARMILESAIEGPAAARIPGPREAFIAFAYHVLYHKGIFAGVPSTLKDIEVNRHPENDYKGTLQRLATNAGIHIDMSMESLDDYLANIGWRPKLDTLAKIASRNLWVWKHFFSGEIEKEVGLGVIIIKRKAVMMGIAEAIEQRIQESSEFKILRKRVFADEEVTKIADQLRGGVWNEKGGKLEDFLPAIALAVVDINLAASSGAEGAYANSEKGIKALKGRLRGEFKSSGGNLIHSTDNTHEAGEYLDVCFPGDVHAIRIEAEEMSLEHKATWFEKIRARAVHLPRASVYSLVRARRRFARGVMMILMR